MRYHMNFVKIIISTMILTGVFISGYGQTELEYEIIFSLIKSSFKQTPNDTIFDSKGQIKNIITYDIPEIIVIDETVTQIYDPRVDSLEAYQKLGLLSLDLYTFYDFFARNKTSIKIEKIQITGIKVNYLSKDELEDIFDKGYWKYYHELYGYQPTVKISRPGINESKNKAFIYFEFKSDKLAGRGYYLILEKVNDEWIVKESMLEWMS